jgi:hypothetical protein
LQKWPTERKWPRILHGFLNLVTARRESSSLKREPQYANIRSILDDMVHEIMHDSLPDSDAVLAQFNRLIQELLRGNMHRNTFRPWEVELLLDIESCNLRESSKRETLRRYQKAVQRHMEKGARLPLKLSEYLDAVKNKRGAQTAQIVT